MSERPSIRVLAGTNGAGKSSVGGAFLRAAGGEYFNPDEVARRLLDVDPGLDPRAANGRAWGEGLDRLRSAVAEGHDYVFETTLGGRTFTRMLREAAEQGFDVRIWYVGLTSPELHIARVAARVGRGGHDIPAEIIRRRFDQSRWNLIQLLPALAELKVLDNSYEASPHEGVAPRPTLVLHLVGGRIVAPDKLQSTPEWAKPIVAAAIKMAAP